MLWRVSSGEAISPRRARAWHGDLSAVACPRLQASSHWYPQATMSQERRGCQAHPCPQSRQCDTAPKEAHLCLAVLGLPWSHCGLPEVPQTTKSSSPDSPKSALSMERGLPRPGLALDKILSMCRSSEASRMGANRTATVFTPGWTKKLQDSG